MERLPGHDWVEEEEKEQRPVWRLGHGKEVQAVVVVVE